MTVHNHLNMIERGYGYTISILYILNEVAMSYNTFRRNPGTDSGGSTFSESAKLAVWNKGNEVPGYDRTRWRYDVCGNPINWFEYGNTQSKNGWEIDHIKPIAKGGTDDLSNLQPLQWETNRSKSDTYPWSCR